MSVARCRRAQQEVEEAEGRLGAAERTADQICFGGKKKSFFWENTVAFK